MLAALLTAPGRIEIRAVPAPEPGAGEVLLRPAAVGLCGTDFHIHAGEANYHADAAGRPVPLERSPQILGHEITAIVDRLGPGACGSLRAGDRVLVDQGRSCSSRGAARFCEYCETGDLHQCEQYAEHGITGLPGALAERMAVPAVNCIRIEGEIPLEQAVLAEPLACVLHNLEAMSRARTRYAVGGVGGGRRAETIWIAGAGPAGLLFIQALRNVMRFDGFLITTDPDPAKRARALAAGASAALDPAADLPAIAAALTRGKLAEILIDACGAGSLFTLAPGLLRKQGTFLLYGHGHGGTGLEALNTLQFRETAFVTACGASGGHDADGRPAVYRRALELLQSRRIEVSDIITHRAMGLEEVPAAFSGTHRESGYVKAVVHLEPHRQATGEVR